MRLILLPLYFALEGLAFIAAIVLSVIHRPTAKRLVDWVLRTLPDVEWFFDTKEEAKK